METCRQAKKKEKKIQLEAQNWELAVDRYI